MDSQPPDSLRLTVLGCSTAAPHTASPAAGFLVEYDDTALMLDAGQGTIRRLQRVLDPHDLTAAPELRGVGLATGSALFLGAEGAFEAVGSLFTLAGADADLVPLGGDE